MTYNVLSKLSKNKKKGGKIRPHKALTLDDVFSQIAETAAPTLTPSLTNVVLTPLSAEACLRNGINPDVLRKRDFESFFEPKLDVEVQRMRHEAYARRRNGLMRIANEERVRLIETRSSKAVVTEEVGGGALVLDDILKQQEKATSALVETERRRISKALNRQKKELLQTLQFEQRMEDVQSAMRDKAEREALEEERRRKEKKKQVRRVAEERRIRQLRRKAQEDMESERLRLVQQEQYERERNIQKEKELREKEAKKRVKKAEAERVRKTELHKLQTQHYLEQQQLEFDKKLKAQLVKEMEREAKIEIKKALDDQEAEARRMETSERLEANRLTAAEREEKRKSDLLEKQRQHEEIQYQIQEEQEKQRQLNLRRHRNLEKKRSVQVKETRDREEGMKEALRKKFEDDEEYLAELNEMKKKELALLKEESQLREQLKKDNVERIKRMHEYRRLETMRKVADNAKRADKIVRTKEELINERRCAAREAKIQKDKIMSILEQTKIGGGRSMKKMLAVLSTDDGGPEKKTGKTRRKKSASPMLERSQSEGCIGGIDDLGPPPEAPTLLARLKTAAADPAIEAYKSPYESSGGISVAHTM